MTNSGEGRGKKDTWVSDLGSWIDDGWHPSLRQEVQQEKFSWAKGRGVVLAAFHRSTGHSRGRVDPLSLDLWREVWTGSRELGVIRNVVP